MKLNVATYGSGENVVLLHSGLQVGNLDFKEQAELLKDRFRLIIPDLRGHGKSLNNDFDDYFEECAKDLKETLDESGVDKVHIVGSSFGAIVAVKFALHYEDYIKTLTLSGIMLERPSNYDDMHRENVELQQALLENDEAVEYFDTLHQSNWKSFIEMAKDIDWYPFKDNLKSKDFTFPTLYLIGGKSTHEIDSVIQNIETTEERHIAIVPFAGHLTHHEQPELFASIITEFILNYPKL